MKRYYKFHMNNQYIKKKLFFVTFPFLLLMVFPTGALIYSLMFLIVASKYLGAMERRLLSLVAILASSLVVSSRGMFLDSHDDFIRYYELYNGLLDGNLDLLFRYGSGVEVGLPTLYYILGCINPVTSPALLAFEGSLCIFLILFIWLEKHGLNHIKSIDKALVVGVTLLFFSAYDTSQLIRQMFAMSILLFTFTSKGKVKFLYLLLAVVFHTTAIIIFIFLEGLKRNPKITILAGGTLSVFFILFFDSVSTYFMTDSILESKFVAYKNNDSELSASTVVQDIKAYFVCALFLFINSKKTEIIKWKYFVIFFSVIYFLFHYLPITPSRISMIYVGILYGYLLCIILLEYSRIALIVFVFLFFILTILICDEIHKYEMMIPRNMTIPRAQRLAIKKGDDMDAIVNSAFDRLRQDDQLSANVTILRWSQIQDQDYQKVHDIMYQYRNKFEQELRTSSGFYIKRRLAVATLTEERLENFTKYTLAELPVQLLGLNHNNRQYTTIFHPVYPRKNADGSAGDVGSAYVSPIETVVNAYRNNSDVASDISRSVPHMEAGKVTRVFFDRPVLEEVNNEKSCVRSVVTPLTEAAVVS